MLQSACINDDLEKGFEGTLTLEALLIVTYMYIVKIGFSSYEGISYHTCACTLSAPSIQLYLFPKYKLTDFVNATFVLRRDYYFNTVKIVFAN